METHDCILIITGKYSTRHFPHQQSLLYARKIPLENHGGSTGGAATATVLPTAADLNPSKQYTFTQTKQTLIFTHSLKAY